MKLLISVLLLISFKCNAQYKLYSQDQMQQKTVEAVAKFYKLDIIGEEAARRIQEKMLPKKYQVFIPYFGTLGSIFVSKRVVFRREF